MESAHEGACEDKGDTQAAPAAHEQDELLSQMWPKRQPRRPAGG